MDHLIESVSLFHSQIGAPVRQQPSLLPCCPDQAAQISRELYEMIQRYEQFKPGKSEFLLRLLMAVEELAEWAEAHATQDLVAAADAWGDRMYLLIGDAVSCGLPAGYVFEEVHRSNMTKTAGGTSGNGKGIKAEDFEDPRLGELLRAEEE